MTQRVTTILAAALAAAAFVCAARAETPEDEIRRAILQLDDDDAKKRDDAEALLREIGPESALLYREDDQGRAPEVRQRMRVLLEAWNYHALDGLPERVAPFRLLPWEPVEQLGEMWRPALDDDRLKGFYLACRKVTELLKRPDLSLDLRTLEEAWARDPDAAVDGLLFRGALDVPQDSRERLIRILEGYKAPGDPERALLLWRLGQPRELHELDAAGVRRIAWLLATCSEGLGQDRVFCDALAKNFVDTARMPDPGDLPRRFPSAGFLDYYRDREDFDSLGRLDAEVAAPVLRRMLPKVDPPVRFKVAVLLANFGEVVPELSGFTEPSSWNAASWRGDELLKVARLLPGQRVEQRLRVIVDHPGVDLDAKVAALRALAARGRARDITFIYTRIQELPEDLQPELFVDLARLGSAAGVGLLVPRLHGCDFDVRRSSHLALRAMTGQDFGYDPAGTLPERCRAARKWALWWRQNRTSFHPDVK